MTYLSEAGKRQAIHLQHLLEFIQSPALRIESCQDFILETIQHSNHFLFRNFFSEPCASKFKKFEEFLENCIVGQ